MSTISIPNLRELRLKKGWSQDHLAMVTSLSKRTIQRIESGTLASLETANSLVCALGLSGLHELCSEQEDAVTPLLGQDVATPPLMNKREPVVFENKPMNNMTLLLLSVPTVFLIASIVVAANLLLIEFAPHMSEKKMHEYGTVLPIVCGAYFLWALLMHYSEHRSSQDKADPRAKEEILPLLSPYPKMEGKDGPKGFFDFIRKHPVRKGEFPIGINERNGNMVFTKGSTGVLMVGEEGSGIWPVALGQLYPMLCTQRPGLIILPRESANLVLQIKSVLSTIGRADDLTVLSEQEAQTLSSQQITQYTHERKILVFVCSSPNDFASNHLLKSWLDVMSYPMSPDAYTPSLLCISDESVDDATWLRKTLKRCRLASSLWAMLIVTDPERFISPQVTSLMSYFGHKHLLRQHSPFVAEQLLNSLWAKGTAPVRPDHLLTLQAGVSVYTRDGLCWDTMRLTYLGNDMYKV